MIISRLDWESLDSGGTKTIEKYTEIIKKAKTVIWNGPIGVFELDNFAKGTFAIARALAESDAKTIIGGGDSAAAVKKLALKIRYTIFLPVVEHPLEFLEGKALPGVEALDDLVEEYYILH